MAWVKRNLGLVIGGVVALALMALAVFFLLSKMQEDREVSAQLDDATLRFQGLLGRPVHPGNDKINNIERAKEENKRLEQFLTQVRAQIATPPLPKDLSHREFRAMLDNTMTELQRDAEKYGITLPVKDYWFTFAPQKSLVEFKSLEMLTHQLLDVKALCDIMYEAKIHDLKGLRRVPLTTEDNNTTDFLNDKKAKTNDFTIVMPYEVSFQGFSTELAKVMEGLVNSERCFVIRSVTVEKATEDNTLAGAAGMMPMYNPMNRYRQYAPPPQYAPPAPKRPGNVLLDENKLKFTLVIDSVRLKSSPDQKLAQASPMAGTDIPAP